MENKINEMKSLIEKLNKYSDAYYIKDNPLVSDKIYDDLMDRLETLENETGIILGNSPLHIVQGKVLDGFKKVKHTHQMKSANKTKDMNVIKEFISKGKTVESWKEDGLTIVCRYINGNYSQAITRGTSGIEGEDVTEAFRHCINLPLKLSKPVDIEVRGECLISWDNFNKINETLVPQAKHPRNLAAGSVRNLDTNIAKKRYLEYKVFELVQDNTSIKMDLLESYEYLSSLGFDVVEHKIVTVDNFIEIDNEFFNPENYKFTVDGTIYKYDSYKFGEKLGETEHHPLNMIARKWKDDLYETTLRDIEWNTTRSGVVNPIAIFDEVLLDNCATTRATLNNISFIENLELGIGDNLLVYRANGVIPTIHDNLTRSNTYKIIDKCPYCGGDVEIRNDNGSKSLFCCNDDCGAKLISKLAHFVSKKCLNVDGLSEAILSTFVEQGWINSFTDLFTLEEHYNDIIKLSGFGKKSADNIINAINNAKTVKLENFICSLGIPLIGFVQSKELAKFCNGDINEFAKCINSRTDFSTKISGFGDKRNKAIYNWFKNTDNREIYKKLVKVLTFTGSSAITNNVSETSENNTSNVDLSGKIYVITGNLNHFKNRDELKEKLESLGAKVSGSVSSKTTALINNDIESTSGKNKKAKELNIPIWSEEMLMKEIGM